MHLGMKQFFFIVPVLLLSYTAVNAQNISLDIFGGFSNYQGDLQDKKFSLNQSHPAFGAGINYGISTHFSARAGFTVGKISGDDKKGEKNKDRNLSFSSSLSEFSLTLEYQLLSLEEHRLTPYVFAGVAYFSFNPYTTDTAGRKVFLQPLSTEGEGFYNGRSNYKLKQLSIPFGGGVKFALSNTVTLALEAGLRKTSTDYLDDVSTTYIDQNILFNNRGQEAVDLAYRGYELPGGVQTYPADGTQRGSAKSKDWYYFSGLHVYFKLNNDADYDGNNSSKNKLGCPRNF